MQEHSKSTNRKASKMTKGQLRRARRIARRAGLPLDGVLALPKHKHASRKTIARKAGRARAAARK